MIFVPVWLSVVCVCVILLSLCLWVIFVPVWLSVICLCVCNIIVTEFMGDLYNSEVMSDLCTCMVISDLSLCV